MFTVTGDPDLLAEMDKEFDDLCLAEDHSTDQEDIKAGHENMWFGSYYEIDRYSRGENHQDIRNLNTNGGHFLQNITTMNNKK